ncbi:hypothetical protein [Mariniblastus fucicola]|uniref:Chromosome partition protein Smc n=1 Tax=Mariniblastus fucicola TaxID=980251 RepID=A0A5B9P2J2_9BACT|nr:hypothetical protein [Mariniblastus fucicola]QEG20737.1 hypothetical protein MFFC18_05880 [Mariniblastus fucicola]
MNDVNRQVTQARRRLNLYSFMHVLSWALFAGLIVAAIGLLVPKVWYLSFLETQDHHDAWTAGWLIGGCALSLIVAGLLSIRKFVDTSTAAIEVDKRFGLKERLSSALSIDDGTAETEVGQALLKDADRSAEVIDVRDKFRFERLKDLALPLIPIAILFAITFLPNAVFDKEAAASDATVEVENVKKAVKEMQKKIEKQRKSLEAAGLKDALAKLDSLKRKFDGLEPENMPDKKQALVELNDIKKEIEERQKELGGSKDLRESLNKLKDVGNGPAKKVAEAMSKGDMKMAAKAVKELAEKLKSGKMSEAEKKKLANDIKQLAKEFQKIQQQHKAKKEQLKKDIKKAMEQGDPNKAAKLQAKLDEMEKQQRQMDKMKKMAQKMQDCANCMKQGGGKKQQKNGQPQNGKKGEQGQAQQQQDLEDAAKGLEDLAKEMEQMEEELKEMEALEDLEKAIGEAKGGMNGKESDKPQWSKNAKGKGKGAGEREREEDKTGKYKSRVKGQLQKGQTVVTGDADGNNISGRSTSEVREIVRQSMSDKADPLENQVLPKSQRDHAKEYFEKLRGN